MKKTLLSAMSLFFAGVTFAQVEDISVTGAPTLGYTWWDNNTAIQDGVMVGGQLGFGFGRGIELRGIYEQSVDLKSKVSEITNEKYWIDKFKSRDVKVTRWGGEFKANVLTSGWLAPYFTLGSGVQTLKVEKDDKQEQIYATAGFGTKFNIGDRVTFNLEGKLSAFNMDPSNVLYDRTGNPNSNEINKWINENTSDKNMINWSVMAGLQFYLGGRTPQEMSAIEAAYNRQFGGGLRGFKLVLEPGVAHINFDDELNLRDTYLLGGSAGFDFTEYVGIRGFYYQATEDEKISKNLDKMSLYGGDFLARLNVARGVVPYITIGGGYMNVYDSYVGKNGKSAKSGYFAKGGAGFSIPLGKFAEAYGAVNMLLTTDTPEPQNNLRSPDELRKNVMYNAGLRFKLGASADGGRYVSEREDKIVESKNRKIAELEKKLKEAYESNDTEKAVKVIQEKRELEKSVKKSVRKSVKESGDDKIRMTPEELKSLISEVVNGVEDKQSQKETADQRIDRLEKLLLEVNMNKQGTQTPVKNETSKDVNQQILNELKKLNQKVEKNSIEIEAINRGAQKVDKTVIVTGTADVTPEAVTTEVSSEEKGKSVLSYKGVSAYTGVNFGGATVGAFGVRAHYGIAGSTVEFAPDLMFGFGSETVYGANANVLLPFNFERGAVVKPYVGLGFGLNNISGDFGFGSNIIVGTSLKVLNGQLYVDYTSRGLFENNQIAVGYRFAF